MVQDSGFKILKSNFARDFFFFKNSVLGDERGRGGGGEIVD